MCRTILIAVLSIALDGQTQTRSSPDLTGTWQMDKGRSQYPAETASEIIQQRGTVVDITMVEKSPGRTSAPMQLHLASDGKATVNIVAGNKFVATTHWEGGKLVTFVQGDRGQHMTEVRQLSSDGKTLTVTGYHQDELNKPYYVRVMVRPDRKLQRCDENHRATLRGSPSR